MFNCDEDFDFDDDCNYLNEINGKAGPSELSQSVDKPNVLKRTTEAANIAEVPSYKKLHEEVNFSFQQPSVRDIPNFVPGKCNKENSSNIRNTSIVNRNISYPLARVQSAPGPKKVVQRKFPGPAGLLPDRRDININVGALESSDLSTTKSTDKINDIIVCSQVSANSFHDRPWLQMCNDFQPYADSVFLPDKYNIEWIKSKAAAKQLINQKAPFLAAIIKSIQCLDGKTLAVPVVLKDNSGEIQATIVRELYEEFLDDLTLGSVIVLKQFGVLTTGNGCNYNLAITSNNLVTIYTNSKHANITEQMNTHDTETNASFLNIYRKQNLNRGVHNGKSFEGSQNVTQNGNEMFSLDSQKAVSPSRTSSGVNIISVQTLSARDFHKIISDVKSKQKQLELEQQRWDLQSRLYNRNIPNYQNVVPNREIPKQQNFNPPNSFSAVAPIQNNLNNNFGGNQLSSPRNLNQMPKQHSVLSPNIPGGSVYAGNVMRDESPRSFNPSFACIPSTITAMTQNNSPSPKFNFKGNPNTSSPTTNQFQNNYNINTSSNLAGPNTSQINQLPSTNSVKNLPVTNNERLQNNSSKNISLADKMKTFKFVPKDTTESGADVLQGNNLRNQVGAGNLFQTSRASSNVINSSQLSISAVNTEHTDLLQDVFEGLDADSLFEDF